MVRVFDIPKLQRLIEEIERQQPEETVAARREYEKRLTEAWKASHQQSSLAILIQSDIPIKDIAAALRGECKSRRRGKPGGQHQRWQRPHYLVAWLAERSYRTDASITHWINVINGWAFMRGKPPLDPEVGSGDHERIKMLLRGSKRRRL